MRASYLKGIMFGLTSGTITTLGMMVGLHSGTHSKLAVLGGVITIAIADAFSDSLGIHISEEADKNKTHKEVWEATITAFLTKFFFALTFIVPLLLLTLNEAIIAGVIWGMATLGLISFLMARDKKEPAWKVMGEHWLIAILVIATTHYVGEWIATTFGTIV